MREVIEKQQKKTFLEKISLELPSCIDYYVFPQEDMAIIYLLPPIGPDAFRKILLPKAGAFVEFSGPLRATFMESEEDIGQTICFNCVEMAYEILETL